MKYFYNLPIKRPGTILCLFFSLISISKVHAQRANIAIPVSIGSPCGVSGGSTANDSVKYFDYNANTNILTHRFNCQPKLAAPGGTFTDRLSTITYNPYDGFLYYNQIVQSGTIYNTHTYRWQPQTAGAPTCPNSGLPNQPVYRTFGNQFVAGLEFDANTGLGYQINFVDTSGWVGGPVDATNIVGQYTSHATVNGNPAVSYFDITNGDLKYVRAYEVDGSSWGAPVAVTAVASNVGLYTSLMVVNGFPAIAYYDITANDLKYVRALDANGTAWGTPVTVEATNDVGKFASMSIVSGFPAIAYYDNTNGDLRYIRATDANGTAWGTPVAVQTTNNVGQYASMKIVSGFPAIAFYDISNRDLRYIRANDATGTTWPAASVAVETTNDVGSYASLEIISGNPAIAHYDVTNGDLRYIRSSDATGTAWAAPVNVASTNNVGQYPSLMTVNGFPAISFYDVTNKDLRYIRATNATGTAWPAASVTVESTNDVGQFSSMIISNGNPSIAYYDVTNGDCRYIRAYDADGTKWFSDKRVYNMELQQVNFTTGALGNSYRVNFGNRYIYAQNGDVVMTPAQQMLAVFDNKYFTINWKDYGTATPLVATFLDTLKPAVLGGAGIYVVGLSYSDGKLVAGLNNGACATGVYKELDINPPYQTYPITYNAGTIIFNSSDMTSISSGIGLSKKLISYAENPVGSKTYDLVYEVVIKNMGTTTIKNVQAYDTLTKINGAGNMLSASISSFISPPGPLANPLYDGKTAGKMSLITSLPGGDTLSNRPGVNEIILRINCKIANIQPGIIYLNQAVGNATNIFNNNLRDSSTNGDNPDLNNNGRSDDIGESQPTPFIIQLVGSTLPCVSMTKILFEQTFGVRAAPVLDSIIPAPLLGVGVSLPIQQTGYYGLKTQPLTTDAYTLTNNPQNADASRFISIADHTSNPPTSTAASANGQMLVVNADGNNLNLYRGGFTYPLCANQQYSLSFYAAFIGNPSYDTICRALNPSGAFIYPKLKIRIRDGATLSIITEVSTGSIIGTTWQQFGVKIVTPVSYTSTIFEIINDAPGGCGNDVVIDDIQFGSCDALPTVNAAVLTGCLGDSIRFTGSLGDSLALPGPKDHQWQVATSLAGPWVDIPGATSPTYLINPVLPSDTGKYYRLVVAAQGNIGTPGCRYNSAGTKLNALIPSTAPSSISAPGSTICNPGSVTLTAVGGTLGTGANYQWGIGAVVGTGPIVGATASTLVVSPIVTTTYWVRIENTSTPCAASTGGVTVTVTVRQPSIAPASISGADICNPGSTTLTAVGGTLGTSANYQWGTGAVVGTTPIVGATASTLVVSPGVTTTYWVRIENTAGPCAATTGGVTKVVTVNQPSTAPASITGANICNPGSVTLTAVGGVLGTSANYQWGTGAVVGTSPIVGATASTLIVSPIVTTTYWVRIENNAGPCPATTAGVTKVITVSQPSAAPASISGADICNPGSTTLTAVGGTLGTSANYQWGTGAVVGTSPIVGATASTLVVSPGVTTTYWVRIENTAGPCTATTGGVTKVVTVNQPSTAPASITGADICNPGSVTLTAIGGALGTGANYQWGTGAVVGASPIVGATGTTLIVSPVVTTTYWVRIENNAGPCPPTTAGITRVVNVSQPSTGPTSISAPSTIICIPNSATLTAVGGTLGSGANYQWGTGAVVGVSPIAGATASSLVVSPIVTTTYWVRIENTTAPCTATTGGTTVVVTVKQPSVAAASATKDKNNICPGISVNLGITGGTLGTNASWKWYSSACGTTLAGTGPALTVAPSVTTTYYVRAEGDCNTTTCATVTIFISCDIDKDKDGVPDFVESNMAAAFADANGNGIINAYDPTYAGFVDNNNDYINDNFQADGDSDNDGMPNYLDVDFPGRVDVNLDGIDDRFDTDLDGKINMLDLDSDNDGIPDVVEAYGVDVNGDGKIDNYVDTDGDGLSDNVDSRINMINGAYNSGVGLGRPDLDVDGVPNYLDLDSDNDGIPDLVEVGAPDTDNNGKVDGFTDANGDGLHDGYINATALLMTGPDGNGDGKADSWPNKNKDRDLRPNAYDLDSDGDGIVDVIEAGLPDANLNGIVDGVIGANGWSTTVSAMAAINLRFTDADPYPDYLDIDSDNDGIPDNIEGMSTASYAFPTLVDADGDGLMNPYDNQPAVFGGSGIFVYDHDADGTPDYRDLDTDADGQPDIIEGNDFNLNGVADDNVTLTGLDTDGDGLDNRFDSLNSVINIKGTSYMMGAGGSLIGDAAPGSRCTVQKKTPAQPDRDWRFTSSVLPVEILTFTGLLNNNNVSLNWTIITNKEIDRFEIERSTNNGNFTKVLTTSPNVVLNVQQSFSGIDDITNVNSEVLYYRLKVIGRTGEVKYSNVLIIRLNKGKTEITMAPNPAQNVVSVNFFTAKDAEITMVLYDNAGKTIFIKKQKAVRGFNSVQLSDLNRYSNGMYELKMILNEEVVVKKLIINN